MPADNLFVETKS